MIGIDVATLTDTGRARDKNEDAILVLPESGILCVADGMGGGPDGAWASTKVVDSLRPEFDLAGESDDGEKRVSRLRRAVNRASAEIAGRGSSRGRPCGSTVVLMVLPTTLSEEATLLHAGDSRAYLFREGELQLLTCDHSVAEAVGVSERNLPHIFKGRVTRAVGLKPDVELDRTNSQLRHGDLCLLCSDGLTRMLPDQEIVDILRDMTGVPLQRICETLVRKANMAGGTDNISVILARVL
jgi:serine/threonine protein phosphatase PrpC